MMANFYGTVNEMQESNLIPVQVKLEVEDNSFAENDDQYQQYILPSEEMPESQYESSIKVSEPYPIAIKEEPPDYSEEQLQPEWIIPDTVSPSDGDKTYSNDGGNSSYSCELCNVSYTTLDRLYDHIMTIHAACSTTTTETTVERKCPFCPYVNSDMLFLQMHIQNAHSKDKQPTECDICGKVFSSRRYLAHHKIVHAAKKEFMCVTCGKQFRREGDYNLHLSTHTKQPFECKLCGKKFGLHRNLLQHEIVHREPEKKFECALCDKRFRRHCDYMAHIATHTNDPFQCTICGRTFPLRRNLLQHEVVHTQERNFECKICGKRFRRQCDYNIHVQVHSDKAYLCNICGKAFSLQRSLVQHLTGHREKKIECDTCGKEFKRKSQFGRHAPCSKSIKENDSQPLIKIASAPVNGEFEKPILNNRYSTISAILNSALDNSNINSTVVTTIAVPDITTTTGVVASVTAASSTTDINHGTIVSIIPVTSSSTGSVLRDALSVPPSITRVESDNNKLTRNGNELQQIVSKLLTKQLSDSMKAGVEIVSVKLPPADTPSLPSVQTS